MTVLRVTDQACKHIITMLDQAGQQYVELGLEQQGCNGYKYTWKPVDTSRGDTVVTLDSSHFIVVSKQALPYVIDSEVTLEESSLMGTRLVLINPHEANSCGCGESVNFK